MDLFPCQRDDFGDSEPVTEHRPDEQGITKSLAAGCLRGRNEARDFVLGQVFARANIRDPEAKRAE